MSALVSNTTFDISDCKKWSCPYCTHASDLSIWNYQGMSYTDLIREFHKDDADAIIVACNGIVRDYCNDTTNNREPGDAIEKLYDYGCYMRRYIANLLEAYNCK
jgi:hypothetical protein